VHWAHDVHGIRSLVKKAEGITQERNWILSIEEYDYTLHQVICFLV
jgi:hypothetical protein